VKKPVAVVVGPHLLQEPPDRLPPVDRARVLDERRADERPIDVTHPHVAARGEDLGPPGLERERPLRIGLGDLPLAEEASADEIRDDRRRQAGRHALVRRRVAARVRPGREVEETGRAQHVGHLLALEEGPAFERRRHRPAVHDRLEAEELPPAGRKGPVGRGRGHRHVDRREGKDHERGDGCRGDVAEHVVDRDPLRTDEQVLRHHADRVGAGQFQPMGPHEPGAVVRPARGRREGEGEDGEKDGGALRATADGRPGARHRPSMPEAGVGPEPVPGTVGEAVRRTCR
jgi:hypothetical protein